MEPIPFPHGSNLLIEDLKRCEARLQTWLECSAVNALWFMIDPADAIRAANIGLSQESLNELEHTLKDTTRELKKRTGPRRSHSVA